MFGGPGILDSVLEAAVAAGFSGFGVDHASVAARETFGSLQYVREALDAGGLRRSDVAVVSLGSGVDDVSVRALAAIARMLDATGEARPTGRVRGAEPPFHTATRALVGVADG